MLTDLSMWTSRPGRPGHLSWINGEALLIQAPPPPSLSLLFTLALPSSHGFEARALLARLPSLDEENCPVSVHEPARRLGPEDRDHPDAAAGLLPP